jgi:lipid kinase YegS
MIRILLNGKKAGLPEIRTAVEDLRNQGHTIEVRTTWEYGDVHRLVSEAAREKIPRIVAGGGDGTVNEVADALMGLDSDDRPEVAILPLGTANDFATSCQIPVPPSQALSLALEGEAKPIDLGKANDRYFVNIATGGFGAQVTTETPGQLKNFLGGGAYTLIGIIKALNFSPTAGTMRTADSEEEFELIVGAVCNGRQAGGGQVLAPTAYLDDGLLDVMMVQTFPAADLDVVLGELLDQNMDGTYVKRFKTQWVETISSSNVDQVNLDGEPYLAEQIRFEAVPAALQLVLPENCPLIASLPVV